jgi:lipopolysaccharide assembly outer membrane protein LptD (OstA)
MKYVLTLILIFIFITFFAQPKKNLLSVQKPDTSLTASKDSLSVSDTTKHKKKYDVDAVVNSSASDSLIFDVKLKKMYLYGSSEIKYKDVDLKSGKIFVDFQTNELEAYGIKDTSDTAKIKLKQTPRLTEGGETYDGKSIKYNFKSQRGLISIAKNKNKDQYYEGETVNKVDKDTYFIRNGIFTTCDLDTPHTYFAASEMKVIQKDEIIAKWIFFFVGGVPFPIPIPFAVFPNERGRRSGMIIPTFGDDANRGNYFHNFGYFWATNDYMDLALTGDYYTRGGYGMRERFRYAERYNFTGNLNAGYSKIITGDANQQETDWNLSWYHNQQINPSTRLDANLQFQSQTFFKNNSINYSDLLAQNVISNVTLNKTWDESGTNMSINYYRNQNLTTNNIDESLPNINFSKAIAYPFKGDNSDTETRQKWYEMIGYNYSGQFQNQRLTSDGNLTIHGGILHNISISASPKVGYFTIAPSFKYTEKWYNKREKQDYESVPVNDPATGQFSHDSLELVTKDINQLNFVRSFNMSVSASSKIYGIFNPNLLGVQSIRHTLLPSVSYNYTPDFSKAGWGYYDSYTAPTGQVVRYDKFGDQIFGGAGAGENQSINFSLGNIFEMKMIKSPSDTSKEQKKFQLLNLNASVNYNFAADSIKLSDLNLDYRTQVGDFLNLQGSSSYTFYDQVRKVDNVGNVSYSEVNQFLSSHGKGLFRLTNLNFTISTTLSGDKLKGNEAKTAQNEKTDEGMQIAPKKTTTSIYDENTYPDLTIPWSLSLGYSYNLSKSDPVNSTSYSSLNASLNFSITKYWKFIIQGSYDFNRKEVSAPEITIYRDLHEWEMNFTWRPTGLYSGFHFEIRLKAPELQDVKVTKSGGILSGRE